MTLKILILPLSYFKDRDFFSEYKDIALKDYVERMANYGWEESRTLNHAVNFLNKDRVNVIVDHSTGDDVGFFEYVEFPELIVMNNLILKPEYRRKGYGSAVFRDIIFYAKSTDKKLQSFYYKDNEASRGLHNKFGFDVLGEHVQLG